MGCSSSKSVSDQGSPEAARSAAIDAQLQRDAKEQRNRVKILLLGAGESGKSTVLKQMRMLYQGSYTDDERLEYREIIFSNVIQSMQAVVEATAALEVPLSDPHAVKCAALIADQGDVVDTNDTFAPEIAAAIQHLWQDPAIKGVVARSSEFQLNDSAVYYFEACERIAGPNYIPTDADILRSRVKTTGITETSFKVDKFTFSIFDVGGQRSERRKWISCFEGVNVLLFLVAISEYDQMLYEDQSVTRISEAMTLFDSISNSRWFAKSCLVLFLNKTDIFATKIETRPLHDYLPEYNGPAGDFQAACKYMLSLFSALYKPRPHNTLYSHFTCATDTKSLQVVLSAVQDTIIKTRFTEAGLL